MEILIDVKKVREYLIDVSFPLWNVRNWQDGIHTIVGRGKWLQRTH